jgi:hypothetical protein
MNFPLRLWNVRETLGESAVDSLASLPYKRYAVIRNAQPPGRAVYGGTRSGACSSTAGARIDEVKVEREQPGPGHGQLQRSLSVANFATADAVTAAHGSSNRGRG